MSHKLLGIDVGGSFIKAGMVDVDAGVVVGELISAPTPQPSSPEAMMPTIASLAARLPEATGRVGLAFPAVVKSGRARTAANVDHAWIGADGAALIRRTLNREALFLNDADAAGLAEMRLGAGRGVSGSVIMLTFGTGIGSALFLDGKLFPSTELGHMEFHGVDAEHLASAQVRTVEHLDWPSWCARVNDYLARLHALFWPDLFIISGAISEDFDQYGHLLHSPAEIRRAAFGAQSGVVGAALAAAAGIQF